MIKHIYDTFAHNWINNGKIFLYSDPHFSDEESYTLRHLLNENTTVEELDKQQIANINCRMGKDDCIIILGDVGNIECVKKLRGYKVLLLGNHDKGASNYKREELLCKEDEYEQLDEETKKKFRLVRNLPGDTKIYYYDNKLFDEVYEGPLMISDKILLSHEPIDIPEYMFNIHGHDHSGRNFKDKRHLNVCAEMIDYTPVSLEDLIKNGLLKNTKSIHRYTIDKRID